MQWCLATKEEQAISLPGDALVAAPSVNSTHAITIESNVEQVWPWIVQMGQDRGGFYSYTWLENLLGCQTKNANEIHLAWQHVQVGSEVRLHPKFPPLLVKQVEPAKHLVLWQQNRIDWTWTFALIAENENKSRLLVRSRIFARQWWLMVLLFPIMTLGHYIMERRMLIGIKQRSEGA